MKQIIWAFIAVFLFAGCEPKAKEGNFTVEGTVEGGSGKQIIFSNIGSRQINPIDTVLIGDDEKFSFGTDVQYADFFLLQIENRQDAITLIGDSGVHITVTAKLETFGEDYTVEGSKDSKLLLELNQKLNAALLRIDELTMAARQSQGADNSAMMDSLNNEFAKISMQHEAYLKQFINKNSSSLASVIALSHSLAPRTSVLNVRDHKDVFNKLATDLIAAHPNSEAAISLKQYMDQVNNPQSQGGNVAVGTVAPEIDLPNPDGKNVKLSSTRGHYVLLDFWAGWCRPCRMENPNLVENYKKYKSKGFTIFQVSLDRTRDEWINAIEKDNLGDWHHVSDLKYWESEAGRTYGVRSIPANFLLDPEGKVIATNLRASALGAKLKEIYGF